MKILVLNGPNLNALGKRDATQYGTLSLDTINNELSTISKKHGAELVFFQSNHEGALIDFLQENAKNADGILINPGALTHYGYSLRDALSDTKLPIVEVHLSNIMEREEFRKKDVIEDIVIKRVLGMKQNSYYKGLEALIAHIKNGR